MEIRKRFLELAETYQENEKVVPYDPGRWNYLLWQNCYTESNADEKIIQEAESNGYFLSSPLEIETFNGYQSRCRFEIPAVLKEIWIQCDGFILSKGVEERDELYDSSFVRPIGISLLPIKAAFGGRDAVDSSDKLLSNALLNHELFDYGLENGYIDQSKVGIVGLLNNCIFLEYFSVDLLCYTLYKMDHDKEEMYKQLYIVLENGPYALSLTLEQYIEAMFDLAGIVFAWPTMFILEDNAAPEVVAEKYMIIARAKKQNEKLGLGINFEKYGL